MGPESSPNLWFDGDAEEAADFAAMLPMDKIEVAKIEAALAD